MMISVLLSILLLAVQSIHGDKHPIFTHPTCSLDKDCPSKYPMCLEVYGEKQKRCAANLTSLCVGGIPEMPIRTCSRARDCTDNLPAYSGWCDYENKYCCGTPPLTEEPLTCPDRLTPLYGQEKCTDTEEGMVYSGKSAQKGGFCYKGYSCPPKITRPTEMSFGSMTFRTNMDCITTTPVDTKYNFMFCHNETGNLWMVGQLNVNGDDVIKHWTPCLLNSDCAKGRVCVKEDLCRYRCYEDPTLEIDYDWIIVQISAMFLTPLVFLITIIFLTAKYLD